MVIVINVLVELIHSIMDQQLVMFVVLVIVMVQIVTIHHVNRAPREKKELMVYV